VYRRRRAVTLLIGTTVAVMLAVTLRLALAGPGGGALTTTGSSGAWPQPISARTYIVQPGDTLWSIVMSSGTVGDPRPAVDRLMAQLGGQPLQIGQRLVLR